MYDTMTIFQIHTAGGLYIHVLAAAVHSRLFILVSGSASKVIKPHATSFTARPLHQPHVPHHSTEYEPIYPLYD